MKNSDILTIAYIGNGKSANRYHLPYLLGRGDKFNVKTIWQRTGRTGDWEPFAGAAYTNDLADILEDSDVDVVVVATPVAAHHDLVGKVLDAGKHCVVEKPFALTEKDAEELFDKAAQKGLILQCYQNRRFDSDFLTVQRVIESGKLGKIFEVEMNFDYYRPETPESAKAFSRADSFIYSHASHSLDQAVSYFGIPERYECEARQILGPGRMNDYFDFDLYYGEDESLKVSVRSSYFRAVPRSKFIVYGTKGVFEKVTEDQQERDLKKFYGPTNPDFGADSPEQFGVLTYYDDDGGFHQEKVPSERGDYGRYYDALYETVKEGKAPLVEPEVTLKVMEMMENALSGMK